MRIALQSYNEIDGIVAYFFRIWYLVHRVSISTVDSLSNGCQTMLSLKVYENHFTAWRIIKGCTLNRKSLTCFVRTKPRGYVSTWEGQCSISCGQYLDWTLDKFPPIYGPRLCINSHRRHVIVTEFSLASAWKTTLSRIISLTILSVQYHSGHWKEKWSQNVSLVEPFGKWFHLKKQYFKTSIT